jgi:hypothetical protein
MILININKFRNEFRELILEDAASILNRQDTDSIPIVDEIRGILDQLYGLPNSSLEGDEIEVRMDQIQYDY